MQRWDLTCNTLLIKDVGDFFKTNRYKCLIKINDPCR